MTVIKSVLHRLVGVRWLPQQSDRLKLNVDGSMCGLHGVAVIVGLLRDWKGEWISGFK
ncbi:hypothetical protein U1Q18_028567, partial [Sarracenia purpurea var. burkii]